MSKTEKEAVLRFERENASLKAENAAIGARLLALETENRLARFERDLTELQGAGYEFDVTEELTEVENLTPEQFEAHKARIVKRYARDPSRVPDITPLRGSVGPDDGQFTTRHLAKAEQYMRDHPGCAWEDARAHAMGGQAKQ